jgi:fatty acyl-CoA reductase
MPANSHVRVQDIYKNKTVLVTGTTGFLGKSFLEKILRICPDVKKIKVIARCNKHFTTAEQRFENDVLNSSIFDVLRRQGYNLKSKIEVVSAQLAERQLGLTDTDLQSLAEGVDLIVNCAASVNFREPLDKALAINLNSVESMITISQRFNIPLVHVSTCYVHGLHQGEMKEVLHKPLRGISPQADGSYDVESLVQRMRNDIESTRSSMKGSSQEQEQEAMIELGALYSSNNGYNDVYTLTKWMGEALIHKHLQSQPVNIIRPAIIESSLREPVPNWLEGVKVCDAILLAWSKRMTSFMPGTVGTPIDVIPVDLVSNAMILAGADALTKTPGVKIIQVASSKVNPITVDDFVETNRLYCLEHWQKLPNLFTREPSNKFWLLPPRVFALLMSAISLGLKIGSLFGNSKSYKKFQVTRSLAVVFGFYSGSLYTFDIANLDALSTRFPLDKWILQVDPRAIDWKSYIHGHVEGVNKYALRPRIPKVQ